jgi:geranylgeranyl reductase
VRTFDRLVVRSPTGSCEICGRAPLLAIVDRGQWIASLVDEARGAGCDVRLGVRALGLVPGRVATDEGLIRFGSLVGADGARSRVRNWLGLPVGPTVRGLQLVVDRGDPALDRLRLDAPCVWFEPARFGPGYAWSFPAADEVRIGCGAPSTSRAARDLKRSFLAWLTSSGIDPARGRMQAGTIGCGYAGHRFGRVFLAGDAAGLASPVTGEGIAQALLSGREVAREILDPGYRSKIVPEIAARHRRTHDVLGSPWLGAALYRLAPWLLRVGPIREQALKRFV